MVKSKSLKSLEKEFHHYCQTRYFFPLANAYRHNNNLDKCIEVLRQGLVFFPRYWAARVALGRALFEKGDFDQALAELEMAADHVPENLLLHRLLATIYFNRGEFQKAARYCWLVLFVSPQDQECLNIMNKILEIQGQSSIQDQDQDQDKPFHQDKPLLYQEENLAEARKEKSDSPSPPPEEEIITPTIAELYLSQGFRDKAIEIYQRLLAEQPDRDEWRERLYAIQGEVAPAPRAKMQSQQSDRIVQQLETWLKNIETLTMN